jgi:hypothetical protein
MPVGRIEGQVMAVSSCLWVVVVQHRQGVLLFSIEPAPVMVRHITTIARCETWPGAWREESTVLVPRRDHISVLSEGKGRVFYC